jgi:plastocyanin
MRTHPSRRSVRLIVCAVLTAAAACGGDGAYSSGPPPEPRPDPDPQPVTAANVDATPAIQFTPNRVTLARGGTVTFRFGTVPHNVFFANAAGAPADIAGVRVSEAVPVRFDSAGTFDYDCQIHPGMRGTVVVQ